jgi:hypothetical protein
LEDNAGSPPAPPRSAGGPDSATIGLCVGQLRTYLQAHDYSGFDPYDGLQSRVFQALPLRSWKWARTAMTQAMKRSPWNLRRALLTPPAHNPKGVALCVSALAHLARASGDTSCATEARRLLAWLTKNSAPGYSVPCWGYNFDWQSRTFYAPRDTPNLACCIAAADALLDAHEQFDGAPYLEMARGTCAFFEQHMLIRASGEAYFRYIPGNDVAFHNVNLLAAALLARVAAATGESHLRDLARQVIAFSVRRQNADGSWFYGESGNQRWIDNFHTGFSLVALSRYRRVSGDQSFSGALAKGRAFWERNFFEPDGAPKYYPGQKYPLDVHSAAQAILTHLEFSGGDPYALEQARRIAAWSLQHLWSTEGFFYFQIHRFYTIRIPYVRWSQAWMFYALAALQERLTAAPSPAATASVQRNL